MITTKTSAAFVSMVKAMIMAPKTTKGLRSSSRRVRLTPFCTWFASLVMRVMRVEVPASSSSGQARDWILAKRAERRAVVKPTATRAAKYWAVTEAASPTAPKATSTPPMRRI